MPYTGGVFAPSTTTRRVGDYSQEDLARGAERVSTERGAMSTILGGGVALGALDLVDTVASSIPGLSSALGVEREDVNRAALRLIDSPGLNDFYHDTRGASEIGSGVAGIIATELVLSKFTKPAGLFMRTASKLPYVRRVAALDKQYDLALQTVRNVDVATARQGILGSQQYRHMVEAPVGVWDSGTGTFREFVKPVTRHGAARTAKALGAARGVREVASREAIYALTMNQNGFLYEDDMAHNLAWMGLGLGLGVVGELAHTAYRIRKGANSDLVRRAAAGALDPEKIEEARLLWHNKKVDANQSGPGSFLGGAITDKATSLFVDARTLTELPVAGEGAETLRSSRSALSTQKEKLGLEELQKVLVKGITTDGRTRITLNAPHYGNHVEMAVYRDPAVFNGAEMIGGVGEHTSTRQIVDTHRARTAELREEIEEQLLDESLGPKILEDLRVRLKRLEFDAELQPMALIDGELMPISEAEAFDGFVEPQIRQAKTAGNDTGKLWEVVSESAAGRMTLDESGLIHFPSGKNLDTADHYDILRAYRLGQTAIQTLKNSTDPIKLPKNPTWFQLDMAEEILQQSGGRAKIVWPAGMTRESAQIESFAQKATGIKKQKAKDAAARKRAKDKNQTYEGMLSRMRVRYNLPRLTAYERGVTGELEHPVEAVLRGADAFGVDEVRKMSLPELKETVARQKRLGDMVPVTRHDVDTLHGNSFRYMLDELGRPVKPVVLFKRAVNMEQDWNLDTLAERLAVNKIAFATKLMDSSEAPMTVALAQALMDSPDFDLVARPHELMETQIQGNITGASPQSFVGNAAKSAVNSEWRDRDSPILLAASRVNDNADRLARDYMKQVVDGAFGDSLSVLKNPRNAQTRLLLNQFHSFRSGWDLQAKATRGADGFYHFVLASTAENQKRFKEQFKYDMPEGQPLLGPNSKEVVLDELGHDIQTRFNAASTQLVREKNAILHAAGRNQIRVKDWYTPPPNTQGKIIGFTVGPDGKTVPGYAVVADTQEAFDSLRAETIRNVEENLGMGYVFYTQDEIRRFADIWDRAEMDFIDPGVTAVQPGKSSRGATTGQQLNVNAFEESMTYLRDNFMRHGNDIKEQLLKEQIQSARMRSNISSNATRNKAGFYRDQKYRGIHDYYLENLLGTSKLNSEGSFVGRLYNPMEGGLNRLLEEATPIFRGVQGAWRGLNIWVRNRVPGLDGEAHRADFNALAQRLGEHMPFKSAMEMAEAQSHAKTPVTVQKITGELNKFTAAVILRMFEVAHPIMNLSGMVNAMPSVIRHLRPLASESREDWASRVGHSAQMFNVQGKDVGVIDMGKIASRAFKRAWSRSSHVDFEYMVRRGYLSQEVAEFQRQFGAIDSKGAWETFFYGDPARKGFKSKGLVGWTGIVSDKSEDFTRSWGHMVGLEIADVLKIEGKEARHGFAHDIANKMIANYNPHNRPEILQGPMGAPIGLFQSFIFNYYQRLFRYAETKDYQALATQYAVQAGLFGVTGLTGWSQISGMLADKSEGEGDIDASIWSRFGQAGGDLLAGGVLSNLPTLFGAPAVDFYSRGDTNVRIPGLGGNSVPALNVLNKMWEGINAGLSAFSDNHPGMTDTQLAEIASNMLANRPLAGTIETFLADGNDTDRYGQLVADTAGFAEATYRMLGVRSMRQSKEIQAFYADKEAQEYQASAKETLRLATRAAIRDGNVSQLPTIFEKYVDTGGDPRFFRRWMLENVESATVPKTQRKLEDLMNNPANMGRVMHLLDRGVGISEDEELGETDSLYDSGNPADPLNQDVLAPGEYRNQMTIEETPDY